MSKTKFIVIKDMADQGKTTLIWMVFLELLKQGATVVDFLDTWTKVKIYPTTIPAYAQRNDIEAELTWKGRRIAIISHGDDIKDVDNSLQKMLKNNPDFIICAASIKCLGTSVWDLFETKYTNTMYERVCFWAEHAKNKQDELLVKWSTVDAIVKYIA